MSIPPKQTLYIRNLNEKIHPNKMKEILYTAFSRSNKLRGQAWIVYEDVSTATAAKSKLNGYELAGKALNIDYAKSTSDAVLKLKNPDEYRERLRKRREEVAARKVKEEEAIISGDAPVPPAGPPPTKVQKVSSAAPPSAPSAPKNTSNEPPNKILFAQNLPKDVTLDTLESLFQKFTGYKEARLVPGHNVAFIEFEDEVKAGQAKGGLHNYKLAEGSFMNLTYAKR